MEDGWKWKHINRSTILYKLLHKFDKLLERNLFYEYNKKQNSDKEHKREVSTEVKRLKSHGRN